VAALTGTADQDTQKTIKETLNLKKDTLTVYVSPNRINLRFSVKKVKKEKQLDELQWLIDIVKEKGRDTPKTIIFCNTMNEIASVTNHLLYKLGISAYDQKLKSPENCLVGIYHSNSWQASKDRISASLKENGLKRIVVSTTALCMGVNFPDIRYIVIWGAARSILDLHQEAGRAGRDGLQSHVIVIYHGQQVGPSEQEVKDFVRSKGCLRVAAYQSLDPGIKPINPLHDCCTYCTALCKCGGASCETHDLPFESNTNPSDITERSEFHNREVTEKDRQDLRSALEEVVQSLKFQSLAIDESASHGFSKQLVDDVVKNCDGIFTVEDILSNYPVFSVGNALRILEVIQELFLDITNLEETSALLSFGLNFDSEAWFSLEDCMFSDNSNDD